jgi:hypothetical protein
MTEENIASSLQIEDAANPQSVSFTPEPKEVKEAPKPPTAREAIEKSLQEIEQKSGKLPENPRDEIKKADKETPNPVKDEPKVEEKAPKERAPDGKFVPKQTENPQSPQPENTNADPDDRPVDPPKPPAGERDINRAPDNFLPRAKEKWAEAPEEVRGEFYRALENFEKGKQEYQEDREFRKGIRDFEEMAKQAGVPFKDAIKNYVEIDQLVAANPVAGIQRILAAQNIDLVQFAQHVLGQAQQDQANPGMAQARALQTQVQQLQQQLQQMSQMTAQQQQEAQRQQVVKSVEETVIAPFKQTHDRYEELQPDIAFFLNSGKIPSNLSAQQRLEEAYYMAERINPAPSSPRNAQRPINPAGEKSIKGSLTNGMDIVPGKGAKLNPREAIAAAMDAMNL